MNLERLLEPLIQLPPEKAPVLMLVDSASIQLCLQFFMLNVALLLLAWLLGSAWLDGLARWFRPSRVSLQPSPAWLPPVSLGVFLALVCGFAWIIAVLFILALFHWLVPQVVFAVLVAVAVLAAVLRVHWRKGERFHTQALTLSSWCVSLPFVLCLAVIQFSAVFTPGATDATSFHVPYADFFLQQHGLAVQEQLIYPYHALNINLLYSLGLMLEHDLEYIQTLHALGAVLTMLGVYAACRTLRLPAFLCVVTPLLISELYSVKFSMWVANVDLLAMCFAFASVWALWCFGHCGSRVYLVVSAMCLGIAMGSKYILCALAFPLGLSIIWLQWPRFWRPFWLYVVWAAVWGLWWYVRNAVLIGNPVHPFAMGIFGTRLWTELDMQSQMVALGNPWIPRNVLGLLQAPYYAWHSEVLRVQDCFLVLCLLFASSLLCWRQSRALNLLLFTAWCWVVSWIWGSQDPRHVLPAVPLVFVYTAAVMAGLWPAGALSASGCGWCRVVRWIGHGLALLCLFAALGLGVVLARERLYQAYFAHLVPGPEQDAFVRQNMSAYDIMLEANKIFSRGDTVYEIGHRDGRWFFHGHLMGNPYGPHGYWAIIDASANGAGMDPAKLQKVLEERYGAVGVILPVNASLPYDQAAFDAYFELKYRSQTGAIYRFRKTP